MNSSRDWGRCLDDEPLAHNFTFPVLPPGAMYDADHQCRLQYGAGAKYCDGIEVSETLQELNYSQRLALTANLLVFKHRVTFNKCLSEKTKWDVDLFRGH